VSWQNRGHWAANAYIWQPLFSRPISGDGIAYVRARQATKRACCFHPSVSANRRQAAPSGPGWAHELKHDGYRLQIHVRDGRVRLYTINGADWSKRYPLIVRDAATQQLLMPKWFGSTATACRNFEALHSRANDARASACAFNLLMRDGDDLRRKPYSERKALLLEALRRSRSGIQYVEHTEGDGAKVFKAVCKLGGIVSKKLDAPYRSGPSKVWLKIKNPKAPAATRAIDGTF
jgi:bifunctional non-homologous end joining protein LigD